MEGREPGIDPSEQEVIVVKPYLHGGGHRGRIQMLEH